MKSSLESHVEHPGNGNSSFYTLIGAGCLGIFEIPVISRYKIQLHNNDSQCHFPEVDVAQISKYELYQKRIKQNTIPAAYDHVNEVIQHHLPFNSTQRRTTHFGSGIPKQPSAISLR